MGASCGVCGRADCPMCCEHCEETGGASIKKYPPFVSRALYRITRWRVWNLFDETARPLRTQPETLGEKVIGYMVYMDETQIPQALPPEFTQCVTSDYLGEDQVCLYAQELCRIMWDRGLGFSCISERIVIHERQPEGMGR